MPVITHTGPNRSVVLTVYALLLVAALLVIGSRLGPPGHDPGPTGGHSPSADVDAR